jgi:hypothetical protein
VPEGKGEKEKEGFHLGGWLLLTLTETWFLVVETMTTEEEFLPSQQNTNSVSQLPPHLCKF